jgi:hypothetical protein
MSAKWKGRYIKLDADVYPGVKFAIKEKFGTIGKMCETIGYPKSLWQLNAYKQKRIERLLWYILFCPAPSSRARRRVK